MPLSREDIDCLGEIVNIGVGQAASSLSELIGTRIILRVPSVSVVDLISADQQLENGMSIMQSFEGEISGNALLVFPESSGQKLAALLGGYDESANIPELEVSGILSEVGNIVLNGVLGSLANMIKTNLTYTVPEFYVNESINGLMSSSDDDFSGQSHSMLYADAQFSVETQHIQGSVVIAFHLGSFENLLENLLGIYS